MNHHAIGTATPSTGRRAAVLFLLAIAAAPYVASLAQPFVYDDHGQIVENAFLRNRARLWDALTLQTVGDRAVVNGRRPMVLVTYLLDVHGWGYNPVGFRLTNLLFHLLTVLTLYFLVKRLGLRAHVKGPNLLAFMSALLFSVHPVLTEAVHAPAFRPDVLCTFFVLVHLLIAESLPDRYSGAWLLRIVGLGLTMAAAITSKESGAVAPLLLIAMWALLPTTRPRSGTIRLLLALDAVVVGGFLLLCVGGAPWQATGGTWNGVSLRFPDNLLTSPWIWVQTVRLLVWPYPLVLDRIVEPVTSALSPRFIAGCVLAVLWCALALVIRRRHRLAAFALLWVPLAFAPVSNLWPLINPMAERYLYSIVVGFALLVATLLMRCTPKFRVPLLVILVVAGAGMTALRLTDWRDERSLWAATLAREPRSARARIWLGLDLKRRQRTAEALSAFEEARHVNPHNVISTINMAIIYGQQGDLRRAEDLLREAIRMRPEQPESYWNLAVDLQLQGQPQEALEALERGLRANPLHLATRQALTDRLIDQGRYQEALELANGTLDIDPHHEQARKAQDYLRWQLHVD